MLEAPCKDCPDRYLGCHSRCEKYQAYTDERKAIREHKRTMMERENDYFTVRRHHRRKDY